MTRKEDLLERIVQLAGLDTTQEASAALRATLTALGERLLDEDRDIVAGALPPELGVILRSAKFRGSFDVADFFDRVRRSEGVSLGFAREHAEVVCRAVAEALEEEARLRMEGALPDSFAELFRVPLPSEPPPAHPLGQSERHHTLATGRPGTRHPVSESRAEVAQAHSVVREANPHAETKVSSARGLTQEQVGESLASAQPDSRRTISKASD